VAIINKTNNSRIEIDISGPAGNAFALMGSARNYAKQLGLDPKPIIEEMMSGDYENLLQSFDKYFGEYIDLVR
jgi:hypothetical protein